MMNEQDERTLAAEFEANKDDMSQWNRTPRTIRSRRGEGPSTIFSLRLTGDELTAYAEFAKAKGMTVSEFLRKAAEAAMKPDAVLDQSALLEVETKAKEFEAAVDRLIRRKRVRAS